MWFLLCGVVVASSHLKYLKFLVLRALSQFDTFFDNAVIVSIWLDLNARESVGHLFLPQDNKTKASIFHVMT